MKQSEDERHTKKEALKRLREFRMETIKEITGRMKEQKKAFDAVRQQLEAGGRTVPELAEGAGIETSQAMWIVAALKKYGEIVEGKKDGAYFRYEPAGSKDRAPL